jgi:hypothetical protein
MSKQRERISNLREPNSITGERVTIIRGNKLLIGVNGLQIRGNGLENNIYIYPYPIFVKDNNKIGICRLFQ